MGDIVPLGDTAGPAFCRPCPILGEHDTSKFFSKKECLNDWLKDRALKAEARTARTYVVCQGNSPLVVGYYCLAMGSVMRVAAPPRIRRNAPDPVPVMLLGRLAVDTHYEGQNVGGGMLKDAFQRAVQASEHVGCSCIMVHAIDPDACSFYAKYNFIEFPDGSKTMFLSIETVKQTIAEA